MPDGIILMKWDERSATEILFKYPHDKSLEISNKTLLHLLNLHGFSKKPGLSTLTVNMINLITYYSGLESGLFVILVLNMLENPEEYEGRFKRVAQCILDKVDDENYKEVIPPLYNRIA